MEPLGGHYAILLHDSKLREGLVDTAPQSDPTVVGLKASERVRFWCARCLRAFAERVEPGWTPARRAEPSVVQ